MDWSAVMKMLEAGGPMAIVAGVMIWHNIKQGEKLTQIIETNTKALTQMQDIIKNLCDKLKP
jgi:hypothetical protein